MADRPQPGVPWRHDPVPSDPMGDVDGDRFSVFVPAIMSVGVLFSIATLLRDAMRWSGRRRSARRVALGALVAVAQLEGEPQPDAEALHMGSRRSYVVMAVASTVAMVCTASLTIAGYLRDEGRLHSIGWVMAVGLGVSALMGLWAAACARVAVAWPRVPPWTLRMLSRMRAIANGGPGPGWRLSAWVLGCATSTTLLSVLVVANNGLALEFDEPVSEWISGIGVLRHLGAIDLFGSTVISIGLVVLVGFSAFRCRVMALVFPAAFVAVWLATSALHEVVERVRPLGFGEIESFPSGHMVQAVFIAGMVPTAFGVLTRSSGRSSNMLRGTLAFFVFLTALHRIHRGDHWPLDAVAGVALGLTAVLGSHWVLEHRGWHQRCTTCPWSGHPAATPWRRGVFAIEEPTARRLGWLGVAGAVGAGTTLLVATRYIGLPTSPESEGLGDAVAEPLQLMLAVLMVGAGLLAIRWRAVGAVLMVLCATGIGLLASVEYIPLVTFLLAALLLVPSVLIWFAWQPKETIGSIAALAVLTVGSLTGTALGSREIYGHYFGPTHPDSLAAPLDSDAGWLWVGGVDSRSAVLVAGGLAPGRSVTLHYGSAGGPAPSVGTTADPDGVARFEIGGLAPATRYGYEIDIDGERMDGGPGDSSFRTFPEGAADLTVVLGSCARTGSNGAVFDRMLGHDPDLYLALGDLHYGNLESSDPRDHLRALAGTLSQPGQSALMSSVPTAYVWDDHDFGPNDADSSSPSRTAVSTAYRQAVPNYGVDPDVDASIAQAFTIGRVRVVMSDTRSQRTSETMLGAVQLEWLVDELVTSAETHALVVWANPTPWISSVGPGADDWSGYPEERRFIADAIAEARIDNLIMVSGDAHMVAIDDGTNSGYATDGSRGFPVLHAAALDRPGNVKGGPYSHGSFPGSGQYGLLEISDDGGSTVTAELSGWDWDGNELVRLVYSVDADPDVS